MNNWFLFTIIATLFWSIGNYIDKYLVSKLFKGASVGVLMVYSSLIIGIIVLPIFFFLSAGEILLPINSVVFLWITALLYFVANYFYFIALEESETTVVIVIMQIAPVFSYFLGAIFLSESLEANQIFGALIVILSSIFISIDFSKKNKTQFRNFMFMLVSTLSFSISFFLFKFVTIKANFYTTAFWEYTAFIVFGGTLLLFPKIRQQFLSTIKKNGSKIVGLNVANEIINIIPKILINYATLLAPIALVWSVAGVQPIIVFILGILLTLYLPKYFDEDISKRRLVKNFVWVTVGVVGIFVLYLL